MEFLSKSSFWTPDYLVESAWHEHAPFAFWLIEKHRPRTFVELGTHHGFSYCCFCQAIERLALETKAFAVDAWMGDDHAGFYGEEVFQRLSEYHRRYSAFSRLVRSSFDDALPHFPDAFIDLLHIDGRHCYEDVKHDFTTWARKLSNRAIVLFHDTNVRERGFGVFQFWQEIAADHRAFEFLHGHGLGVLAFGTEQKPELHAFFEAAADQQRSFEARATYSQLGAAIKREWQLTDAKLRMAALERSLLDAEQRELALDAERNAQLVEGHRRIEVLEKKIAEQGQQVDQYQRRLAEMTSSLSWRITSHFRELYGLIARLRTSPFGVKLAATLRHPTNSRKRKTYRANHMPQSSAGTIIAREPRSFSHQLRKPTVLLLSGEVKTPGHIYRVARHADALRKANFNVSTMTMDDIGQFMDRTSQADLLMIWRARWTGKLAAFVGRARSGGGESNLRPG